MLRRLIILLMLTFIAAPVVSSQTISKEIISAFEKGDAKKLSVHLNHNLEVKLYGKISIVSKNQATRLLQDFFDKNSPVSFTVTYEKMKQGSEYGIGELKTKDATFRVNLYFIVQEKKNLIYKLIIEKSEHVE